MHESFVVSNIYTVWAKVLGHTTWVFEFQHLAMQSAFTNNCEWVVVKSLLNLRCGDIIGSHHCKRTICEISALLDIPQSTVSITAKWKLLGTTATARSHKVTYGSPSAEAHIAEVQTSPGFNTEAQKLCVWSFCGMGFHGWAATVGVGGLVLRPLIVYVV